MKIHYSSKTPEWETPQEFFNTINKEFHLTHDVCANSMNSKCKIFFSKETDGLKQNWTGLRCWMNPPYGRVIGDWVKKAAMGGAKIVVCLLPARTDTRWFHDYIYGKAEIRFIKGRIHFSGKDPAPFPSMIVIFKNERA